MNRIVKMCSATEVTGYTSEGWNLVASHVVKDQVFFVIDKVQHAPALQPTVIPFSLKFAEGKDEHVKSVTITSPVIFRPSRLIVSRVTGLDLNMIYLSEFSFGIYQALVTRNPVCCAIYGQDIANPIPIAQHAVNPAIPIKLTFQIGREVEQKLAPADVTIDGVIVGEMLG